MTVHDKYKIHFHLFPCRLRRDMGWEAAAGGTDGPALVQLIRCRMKTCSATEWSGALSADLRGQMGSLCLIRWHAPLGIFLSPCGSETRTTGVLSLAQCLDKDMA